MARLLKNWLIFLIVFKGSDCTKMKTFIRQAVVKGINAFREKIDRSQLETDNHGIQPLYQKAGWRRNERSKEKAMKMSYWFKGDLKEGWKSKTKTVKRRAFQKDGKLTGNKNTTNTPVVFVPNEDC